MMARGCMRNPSRTALFVLVGGRVVVGTPKTHKRRVVPFPAFLGPERPEIRETLLL